MAIFTVRITLSATLFKLRTTCLWQGAGIVEYESQYKTEEDWRRRKKSGQQEQENINVKESWQKNEIKRLKPKRTLQVEELSWGGGVPVVMSE